MSAAPLLRVGFGDRRLLSRRLLSMSDMMESHLKTASLMQRRNPCRLKKQARCFMQLHVKLATQLQTLYAVREARRLRSLAAQQPLQETVTSML